MSSYKDFGYVDNSFINLYSKDNPILEENDECYFLFTSINNFHMPIIAKGVILKDIFIDGMNKVYNIKLTSIEEPNDYIDKWVNGHTFMLIPVYKETISGHNLKQQMLGRYTSEKFYEMNLFKIESFFVRTTLENITRLREEYISIILKDLEQNIDDIKSLLNPPLEPGE